MAHIIYSMRTGKNPNLAGLSLDDLKLVFRRLFNDFRGNGYFDEYFGSSCVDQGEMPGRITDIELEILLKIRKKDIWPIDEHIEQYSEEDILDMTEFLFMYVSKPMDGTLHDYGNCGMHWGTFNKKAGEKDFQSKMNEFLALYRTPFELSNNGQILLKPETGFEKIFGANIPSSNTDITSRINAAVLKYRRRGSTPDDRRQSVRDLADVLEYLRPQLKNLLTHQDERDLFNLANNFGIRHHNDQQKTTYDSAIWHSWMFYYYLATIHVVLRKIESKK